MRKEVVLLFAGMLLFGINSFSQKSPTEVKADKLYDGFSFLLAIEKYEALTGRSIEATRKLAECYRFTANSEKAELFYLEVVNSNESTPRDIYWLSEVLMMNGKYDEADEWKGKYIRALIGSDEIDYEFKGYYKKLLEDKGGYKVKHLALNSDQQDFGVIYYKDKVVFASSRENQVKQVDRKYNRNMLNFLDMYVADAGEDHELTNIIPFNSSYNSKYHEGPATFSADGNFIVFTRNNYDGTDEKGVRKLKLFYARNKNGVWEEAKEFPFNSSEYSVGHPSLSTDGKTLYFSSDMPGGVGGVDLYKVPVIAETGFGSPINLGKSVNSEYDEMFPYIHPSGELLFFSSDGWPGLGGLDVFYTKVIGDSYSGVKNLGTPINDRKDDFAFVLNKEMKKGYFSSNRPGGMGDDDIYAFDMLKPLDVTYKVKGYSKTKSDKSILKEAVVSLLDDSKKVIATKTTGADGYYEFDIEKGKNYLVNGTKTDYFPDEQKVNTSILTEETPEIEQNVFLEKDPGLSLYCLVVDKTTKTPIADVKVTLLNTVTGKEEVFVTTGDGDFRKILSENKLNDNISYKVTVERKGYLTKKAVYNKTLSRPGQYNLHEELDITMDKIDLGADLAKIINIKPIYFDLSKYNIRKDAAIELDKIVTVMNENPEMEIELGSHTDCRSSAKFNMDLSDKRAKASAKYVQDRITRPDRIYGKGYGETQLVNQCECEGSVKVACSEDEHQLNRRTEFKITKN